MEKEVLLKAKEQLLELAVKEINKGKCSAELYSIINTGLIEIKQREIEAENKSKEEERKQTQKEYADILAKMLAK